MKVRFLYGALLLGAGWFWMLWGFVGEQPQPVQAATLCVKPGGGGGCYSSIQAAVSAAQTGDTVRVAEGRYTETILMTRSIILEGGWNLDFTLRQWELYTTTLNGLRCGPVIRANGSISPTIEGFFITGGDASDSFGWGGGILINGDWDDPGLATIRHNIIYDNIACRQPGCQGYGGGIMVHNSRARIEYNQIISNVASVSNNLGGQGGGLAILSHVAGTVVAHNLILSNTALISQAAPLAGGEGGGVWGQYWITLLDNDIRGNIAAVRGDGWGGGVFLDGYLYHNRILSNTASLTGGVGYGGGVYTEYMPDCHDNLVQGNLASPNGDGTGGGLYALYLRAAHGNTVVGNRATRGGGVYFQRYTGDQTFSDNRVMLNQATGMDTGRPDGGGGIVSEAERLTLARNEILSNTALAGGGLLVLGGQHYQAQDNLIQGNFAVAGGGMYVYSATGALLHNQVISNEAAWWGGGMYLASRASPLMDGNLVLKNTARGFLGGAGGGIMLAVGANTRVTLTNHLIAQNVILTGTASGIHCSSGSCALIHCTIAHNKLGAGRGEGVRLSAGGGVNILWNSIIAGHATGVNVTTGTATLDYNDYYDNLVTVSGTVPGAHSLTVNPNFMAPLAGDYHLQFTASLVDQGDAARTSERDFEGDPRPRGPKPDIGMDEAYRVVNYVSQVTGNDLTGDGTQVHPFATITRALAETQSGGTIYVGQGVYTGCLALTRSVNLLGGYVETSWSRNIAAYGTTLQGARMGTVITIRGAGVRATVEGFTITGGEASTFGVGGGLMIGDGAVATLRYNTVTGNHAQNGGAGIALFGHELFTSVVDSNRIFNNVAEGIFVPLQQTFSPHQAEEPGGGLLVSGRVSVLNNWIYSNTAGAGGDGIGGLCGGSVQVYHNTVVDNGRPAGEGIQIMGEDCRLYNNLIVGHGVAITGFLTSGSEWDYNGFDGNGRAYAPGLSGGLHDVYGAAAFVNRAGQDYHLSLGSPMAGAGTELGVFYDAEGDSRPAPAGSRPDLGADEIVQRRLYLPLVLRNWTE